METNQVNETQTTESPELNNAPAVETSTTPEVNAATPATGADAPAGASAAGVATYSPNFKFKVLDKEQEFDPELKSIIKDAKTEKKFRELYEKAYGLDHVKTERQKLRDEFGSFKEKVTQRDRAIETLNTFVQKNDLHSFFQALQIPEEKVLKYALDRVQYREMDPQQRAMIDAQYEQQHRSMTLEEQNQMLTQRVQEESARVRQIELDTELSRPDISAAAQAFDARVGKPGAFKQEVIDRGLLHWQTRQVDVPAKHAILEVMARYGLNSIQNQNPYGAAQGFDNAGAAQAPVPNQQQQKPVIPNIRGSGASPVRKVPRSIEDLKKLAAQKSAE